MAWLEKAPNCYLNLSQHGSIIYIYINLSTGAFLLRWINLISAWMSYYILICAILILKHCQTSTDQSHITTVIWWPLGVAVVSVTCMRVCWVSHTWKYTQWNIFLLEIESSDKSPYWTNPYHTGFRYKASLIFHTYFGQCPNDIYILLHIPLSCLSKLPAHGTNDCHGP